jgi:hypothetical protein
MFQKVMIVEAHYIMAVAWVVALNISWFRAKVPEENFASISYKFSVACGSFFSV